MKKFQKGLIYFIVSNFVLFIFLTVSANAGPPVFPGLPGFPGFPPINNPPVDEPGPPVNPLIPPVNENKVPFLEAFLLVYQGDWIFIQNKDDAKFSSIDIYAQPCTCNEDETECCGRWELRTLGESGPPLAEGPFCLSSTYEIHIRDDAGTWDLPCIGVRGARVSSSLIQGAVEIADPVIIESKIFKLVRPQ